MSSIANFFHSGFEKFENESWIDFSRNSARFAFCRDSNLSLSRELVHATWCIRGSKEGKSGGRWKDSLSSLRFVRPFFSSRAFNVNIFREEIGEYPPLFPIPFLCFPPVYSRSIRGGDPLDPRSSTLARLRFSFHASFLEGPPTRIDLSDWPIFFTILALLRFSNVLFVFDSFIDLAAGREITERRSFLGKEHLVAISIERSLAKANSYRFARNFRE